jgi:hypothetical protein
MSQVTGGRMTRTAVGIEINHPSFGIAGDDIKNLIIATVYGGMAEREQEGSNVFYLLTRQREFWHPLGGATFEDDGAHLSARAFVMQDQDRADQVRTIVAALARGSMTETATCDEQLLTSLNGRGIRRRRQPKEVRAW